MSHVPLLEEQPCRLVDNYDRLSIIGSGSYGEVYKAIDKRTDEVYALKDLLGHSDANGFLIPFLREMTILFQLDRHENVVTLYEVVTTVNKDRFYLVMEYAKHCLEESSIPHDGFSAEECKSLMKQLLSGLFHLHSNHILHRDLKPCNLLLSNDGVLKIADFGLARTTTNTFSVTSTSKEREKEYSPNVVTLGYRAPELLFGATQYSFPIDIWSVGCIFIQFLTKSTFMMALDSELKQISLMTSILGAPTEEKWPGVSKLPHVKRLNFRHAPQHSKLRQRLELDTKPKHKLTTNTFDLISRMLEYDPSKRITAKDALTHPYFSEMPSPKHPTRIQTC